MGGIKWVSFRKKVVCVPKFEWVVVYLKSGQRAENHTFIEVQRRRAWGGGGVNGEGMKGVNGQEEVHAHKAGGGKLCGRPALEKMRKKCGKMRKYAEKYAENAVCAYGEI